VYQSVSAGDAFIIPLAQSYCPYCKNISNILYAFSRFRRASFRTSMRVTARTRVSTLPISHRTPSRVTKSMQAITKSSKAAVAAAVVEGKI